MERLSGYAALSSLESRYRDFLQDPKRRFFTVLGRPRTGKRWILKDTLAKLGIEAEWRKGVIDSGSLKQALSSPGVLVLYETTSTMFGTKKERDVLMAAIRDAAGGSIPGKIIILDDPYEKRSAVLDSLLDGIEYDFTVDDLVSYVAANKSSIAAAHSLKTSSIDRVLVAFEKALEKKVIKGGDTLDGLQFSVSGLVFCAASVEADDPKAYFLLPQEIAFSRIKP